LTPAFKVKQFTRYLICNNANRSNQFSVTMSSKSSRSRKHGAPAARGPSVAQAAFAQGVGWHQKGQFAQAQAHYRNALVADPRHAGALHHLGILAYQSGHFREALALMDEALSIDPGDASAHNNRGLVLQDMGEPAQALACFERALTLVPAYPDALNNRANALCDLGRHDEAIPNYEAALRINARYPEALKNLADAQRTLGRREAAVLHYDQAIALNPRYVDALINRGNTLRELRQPHAAMASYEQAVALDPQSAQGHNNLGNVLQELRQYDRALTCFERAIQARPDYARAFLNRGLTELALGRSVDSQRSLERACALDPNLGEARWALAMTPVAPMAEPATDDNAVSEEFIKAIDQLEAWIFPDHAEAAANDVGSQQPFYLAYRETNHRAALSRYGSVCARVMTLWQRARHTAPPSREGRERIRIGIVSNHVHEHSVWNAFLKGIVLGIDPARFELCIFSLGTLRDEQTALARQRAWAFVDDKWTLDEWVEAISALAPDALLYPEIGMDAMTTRLASLRLAPVQLAAWGHPETTGLPTIDHYITASDFEPPGCQMHYSEQVLALPGLGCSYPRLNVVPQQLDLAALGLSRSTPLLLCPGVPFKYSPRFDALLVGIARQLGACQFVFFDAPDSQGLGTAVRARMRRAFDSDGLRFDDFARILPWQGRSGFHALMTGADVFLDTVGFSGFNTAMQAIECSLPIVTLEGKFMRGRFASAILRRIGLDELVATTDAQYIALAVDLASDPARRVALRAAIEDRSDQLFDDNSSIFALQAHLAALCKKEYTDS
jgi:predicted O-linked N-acetylglucosamine transferase (SPINDLY family)